MVGIDPATNKLPAKVLSWVEEIKQLCSPGVTVAKKNMMDYVES